VATLLPAWLWHGIQRGWLARPADRPDRPAGIGRSHLLAARGLACACSCKHLGLGCFGPFACPTTHKEARRHTQAGMQAGSSTVFFSLPEQLWCNRKFYATGCTHAPMLPLFLLPMHDPGVDGSDPDWQSATWWRTCSLRARRLVPQRCSESRNRSKGRYDQIRSPILVTVTPQALKVQKQGVTESWWCKLL
jgi:hypothetical protein